MPKAKAKKKEEVITLNYSGQLPDPCESMPLESLEKELELKRARLVYARQQEGYWREQAYRRDQQFADAMLAVAKRKHGLTDEQIRDNPAQVWTYGNAQWK